MRRADCTGGQHDSIGGQQCRSRRPVTSTPIARPPEIRTRRTRVPDSTLRLCRVERGTQERRPRAGPHAVDDVERYRTDPGGQTGDPPSLRSGSHGNPALRAASTKIAVLPTISRVRRTGIGPLSPWAEPCGKSRSVSTARKCGSTSDQAQPSMPHSIEVGRHTTAEVSAVDRAGPADRGTPHEVRRAAPGARSAPSRTSPPAGCLRPTAAADHCRSAPATPGTAGPGPASTTVTRHPGSTESRSATADPALPAPMIRTSLCGGGLNVVVKSGDQVRICGLSGPMLRSRITPVHNPTP